MASTITLQFEATCADCGAELSPGEQARYYGRGRIYGIGCHAKPKGARGRPGTSRPAGLTRSQLAVYEEAEAVGAKMHSASCGCIDYPCCGH